MFKAERTIDTVSFTISSKMQQVDRVLQECVKVLGEWGLADASEFNIVLRELLINAIEHGNKGLAESPVRCRVQSLGGRRLKAVVEDEGEGFDFAGLSLGPPDDPRRERHRGYALIHAFSDDIRFDNKGSRITVFVTVPIETSFKTRREGEALSICPTGDLTAHSAERLRAALVEALDADAARYRLDLEKVQMIDSVSLSVLMCFARMLKERGNERLPELTNVSPALVSLFAVIHLDRSFHIGQ